MSNRAILINMIITAVLALMFAPLLSDRAIDWANTILPAVIIVLLLLERGYRRNR